MTFIGSRTRVVVCMLVVISGATGQAMARDTDAGGGGGESRDWVFTVGAGLLATPNYIGDDAYQLVLAPSVSATDGAHWSISFLEGVQYTVNRGDNWRWGVAVAPSLGRDSDGDSPLRVLGDGTDDLVGLADTKSAAALRFFTEYKAGAWSLQSEVRQTFTSEQQSTLSLALRRSGKIATGGPPLIVSGGVQLRAGSQQGAGRPGGR